MEAEFRKIIEHTLEFEGGYVNDPVDPGGETKYGISKRAFPLLDIKNLTKERAIAIYYTHYWVKSRADLLSDYLVSAKYFDLCVNMGLRSAGKLLQKAYNALGFDPLVEDGIVGSATIRAINSAPDQGKLLESLINRAVGRYENIIAARPTMEKYRHGWLRRAKALPKE